MIRFLLPLLLSASFLSASASAQNAPITLDTYAKAGYTTTKVFAFKDEPSAAQFRRNNEIRALATQQAAVLSGLLQEKQAVLKELASRLNTRFKLKPDGSYRYDIDTNVLFERDQAGEEKQVLTLKDKNHIEELKRLMTARRTVEDTIRALALVSREKQQLIAGLNAKFKDEQGVKPDLDYFYDNESRTIYQVSKPAAPATPGPVQK